VVFEVLALIGCAFMRDLIWDAIVINAFSTLVAFLAEVSKNSIASESAKSYKY
jgi:hypothetical protein